jgi:hypothetical protein
VENLLTWLHIKCLALQVGVPSVVASEQEYIIRLPDGNESVRTRLQRRYLRDRIIKIGSLCALPAKPSVRPGSTISLPCSKRCTPAKQRACNQDILSNRIQKAIIMPTVYVTDYTYTHLDYERAILEPLGCSVIGRQCRTAADVIAQCGDAIALLNQYAPITREVFAALPNLKMVVRYGVGYDSVDVAAATEHGVMVVNVPDYGVQEVADHTLALLLAMVRKIPAIVNDVTAGHWNDNTFHPIMGLAAKTVGLLGFGNIAKEVAKRAQSFNMQVQAYDPYVATEVFAAHHVTGVSAETVFATSDIICVHLPLNDQTRHFVAARRWHK